MFLSKFVPTKNALRAVSQVFVRHARTDPGISKRRNLLSRDELESNIDLADIETDFDDLETDFMNIHKGHKEHLSEMEARREREKYHIVKRKYFKEKYPNFLTWHDKEQIKHLHRTDPEEWTVEKLSEGFPALPETIIKIVKADWTKRKQGKVTNHDSAVQKNWEKFKAGQFAGLPQHLVEHLQKFTSRELQLKPFELPKSNENRLVVKTATSEFSDIITSYEKIKNKGADDKDKPLEFTTELRKKPLSETYINSDSKKGNMLTLSELQNTVIGAASKTTWIGEEDKLILEHIRDKRTTQSELEHDHTTTSSEFKHDFTTPSEPEHDNTTPSELEHDIVDLTVIQNKYQIVSKTGTLITKMQKDMTHLSYPERIRIPKDKLRRGRVYKLNDCFYDGDGMFLYRVPGMC